ncbi:MAG: 4Fe-4S single cluster domain-containing protein, partial [Oscillospiraceae bacterium]
ALLPLLRRVRAELPKKDIWCYTGYTYERDILNDMCVKYAETPELIKYIDVLVDGEFILARKNISLRFRGSDNQRIIDVKKSLETGETVLWE